MKRRKNRGRRIYRLTIESLENRVVLDGAGVFSSWPLAFHPLPMDTPAWTARPQPTPVTYSGPGQPAGTAPTSPAAASPAPASDPSTAPAATSGQGDANASKPGTTATSTNSGGAPASASSASASPAQPSGQPATASSGGTAAGTSTDPNGGTQTGGAPNGGTDSTTSTTADGSPMAADAQTITAVPVDGGNGDSGNSGDGGNNGTAIVPNSAPKSPSADVALVLLQMRDANSGDEVNTPRAAGDRSEDLAPRELPDGTLKANVPSAAGAAHLAANTGDAPATPDRPEVVAAASPESVAGRRLAEPAGPAGAASPVSDLVAEVAGLDVRSLAQGIQRFLEQLDRLGGAVAGTPARAAFSSWLLAAAVAAVACEIAHRQMRAAGVLADARAVPDLWDAGAGEEP